MPRYLLSVYEPAGPIPEPEFLAPIMREVDAVTRDMQAAGVWVFAGGLQPPSVATVVRLQAGNTVVTDGPFAETKEHLGGFTIVDAPDLEGALEWARRLTRATTLPIEVREFRWRA